MDKQKLSLFLGFLALLGTFYYFWDINNSKIYLTKEKIEGIKRKLASLPLSTPPELIRKINDVKGEKEVRKKLRTIGPKEYFEKFVPLENRWIISKTYGGSFKSIGKGNVIRHRNIILKKLPILSGEKVELLVFDKKLNKLGVFTREVIAKSRRGPDLEMLNGEKDVLLLKSFPQIGTHVFRLKGEDQTFEKSLEVIKDSFEDEVEIELDVKYAPLSIN